MYIISNVMLYISINVLHIYLYVLHYNVIHIISNVIHYISVDMYDLTFGVFSKHRRLSELVTYLIKSNKVLTEISRSFLYIFQTFQKTNFFISLKWKIKIMIHQNAFF